LDRPPNVGGDFAAVKHSPACGAVANARGSPYGTGTVPRRGACRLLHRAPEAVYP